MSTDLRRENELKAVRAAEAYRDHRDQCNTCCPSELCDIGHQLLEARQAADEATAEYR